MYNFVLVFISPMHIAETYKNVYQGQQCRICRTPVSLPSASPCIPNVSISMLKNTSPKQNAPFGLRVQCAYLLLPLFYQAHSRVHLKGLLWPKVLPCGEKMQFHLQAGVWTRNVKAPGSLVTSDRMHIFINYNKVS